MNTTSQITEAFRGALEHPERGVVGLVDDLLRLCPKQGVRLVWGDDGCRVDIPNGASEVTINVPLSKSTFRALLARFAALCNERIPDSVSPYEGNGELSLGTNAPPAFRVSFTNTPAQQMLELTATAYRGIEASPRPIGRP
jgi:hypothetical protein